MQGGGQEVTMMVLWRYTCVKQSLVSKSDTFTIHPNDVTLPSHQEVGVLC